MKKRYGLLQLHSASKMDSEVIWGSLNLKASTSQEECLACFLMEFSSVTSSDFKAYSNKEKCPEIKSGLVALPHSLRTHNIVS